jgi:hypothetical protein
VLGIVSVISPRVLSRSLSLSRSSPSPLPPRLAATAIADGHIGSASALAAYPFERQTSSSQPSRLVPTLIVAMPSRRLIAM